MKETLLIILLFSGLTVLGQPQGMEREVESILNVLIEQNILVRANSDFALQVAPYQFDGDYATERVFPNVLPNSTVCLAPITFERSVRSVLEKKDDVYDSAYYQQQIQAYKPVKWSEQDLTLMKKIKFIDSRFSALFYKEIGRITYPLFSKDGKTAALTYATVKRNSVSRKKEAVYILKKKEAGWQIMEVIDSKKIW